ncbi:MAG: sigma-54-dependent transcriptional regulator, partial [Gemmatimonadota bacterium]
RGERPDDPGPIPLGPVHGRWAADVRRAAAAGFLIALLAAAASGGQRVGMSEAPSPSEGVSVLIADDDADQRVLMERILRSSPDARYRVTSCQDGTTALVALREEVFDVALLDLDMPGLDGLEVMEAVAGDPARPQVVFVSGVGTVTTATRAMKLGAFDFLEKPVEGHRLQRTVWRAVQTRRVQAHSERMREAMRREAGEVRIVTADPRMRSALELLRRVAPSDVSVLIVGESGTGKELVARELHRLSGCEGGAMVVLNCAAVTESLAESELFGHEKGAFTGAAERKLGLVELADQGTLFLDEIGELPLSLQAKLLRTLETRLFRRVGGVKELPANFRLVSATHRALEEMVGEGAFRQDLYYRINPIVLELPPLRDRHADILPLAHHFLRQFRPGGEPWTIADDARAALEAYAWPGNVRELRNVMERAALLSTDLVIRPSDLGHVVEGGGPGPAADRTLADAAPLPDLNLDHLEELAIREALERTAWHQGDAAELLGISSRTLRRKIRALGLERPAE